MATPDTTPKEDESEASTPVDDSAEESTETPEVESKEDEATEKPTSDSGVKVPESFQKECVALLSQCSSEACLDYLSAEVAQMRHKLMSSQKKNHLATDDFSDEGMPE